ncbi:MAG TPA: enolase C-terminal domain-like protein [Candidatus Dormibacteraeota bacterium]
MRATPVVVPLDSPLTTASGSMPEAPLLLVDLDTEQGVTGRSYVFAYQALMLRPLRDLIAGLAEPLVGKPLVPADLDRALRARFTLLGGAVGLAGMAVSALDTAAWDAVAVAAGRPLAALLGARPRPLPAYDSLGLVTAAQAAERLPLSAERGFRAVKIKIGWPALAQDVQVVRAAREALPDAVELMVDFNQSLDVTEALRRCRALDGEGVAWIEEPVRCDDFEGAAAVTAAVNTPIQIGENFRSVQEMALALERRACDLVMPDPQVIGGVTGWIGAAALAAAAGVRCSGHIHVESTAHLLAATPTAHYVEWLDLASAVLAEPLQVVEGQVSAPDRPGIGLAWDPAAVARYRLS